jgi:sterol desaturase/sphingolipid hydroxylase (fatty acid hydroxylase superfamily)
MTFCPLKNDSTFHDYHHSHNEGTFGSMFTVMDQIFGTDKGYKKYVKKD